MGSGDGGVCILHYAVAALLLGPVHGLIRALEHVVQGVACAELGIADGDGDGNAFIFEMEGAAFNA